MNAGKLAAFMVGFAFGRKGWSPFMHLLYWATIAAVFYTKHR